MNSRWSDQELAAFAKSCDKSVSPDFAAQIYVTRLLGIEPDLALHGGGNTSIKTNAVDLLDETRPALIVKASGAAMAGATERSFVALDIDKLHRLHKKSAMSDEAMAELFRFAMLQPDPVRRKLLPSIETLLHLLLPFPFIDHTHPSAVLALTNRHDAAHCLREAFGTRVAIIPYAKVGFECAHASMDAVRNRAYCSGLVIMHHGLVTWGETAKEAYQATIKLVSLAETYLAGKKIHTLKKPESVPAVAEARARYEKIAPMLRGLLSPASGNADMPYTKIVLRQCVDERILVLLSAGEAKAITATTPLTPDYLIRVRRLPLFVESPDYNDTAALRGQITRAREQYFSEYRSYLKHEISDGDIFPKVLCLPGIGCVCAGDTAGDADIAADIMTQALSVKQTIFETDGEYLDLSDDHCRDMEFRSYQRAKLKTPDNAGNPLAGSIVLVTGAAGAIGAGLCSALLEAGCHLAVADLAGDALDAAVKELEDRFGAGRVLGVGMDVTDPVSVEKGYASIAARFGGLDSVIVNAGIAHVAVLADMEIEAFRKIEKVNIEGTLLTIREAAKIFKLQNTGGDIVLISTKNVFAPGASFGAYSATKAAAHQLARIASLELADIGVRVNMVAPDAVFSHGNRKSGLWATVGPDRMRSRGLDEAGLEEYYRTRNLLKAKVTAGHVAAAVLFFLSHRTPTTGATLPVDGGLPDSTPR